MIFILIRVLFEITNTLRVRTLVRVATPASWLAVGELLRASDTGVGPRFTVSVESIYYGLAIPGFTMASTGLRCISLRVLVSILSNYRSRIIQPIRAYV